MTTPPAPPTPPTPRSLRIRLTTLAAIAAVPLLALTLATAWGQNVGSGGGIGNAREFPLQQYRVLEPADLIFNSVDLAASFIGRQGNDGWIFPDGTQIIAHTFDAGMSSQYTRHVIRVGGPYREDSPYLIIRRERRIPAE